MALYDSNEWQFIKIWIILHHTLHILKNLKISLFLKTIKQKTQKLINPPFLGNAY